MQITSVKIQKIFDDPEKMLLAVASVTVDDMLAIHDIRLLKSVDKMFIAMPNKKLGDATYKDVVHPVNSEGRKLFEVAVISAYEEYMANLSNNEADSE